MWSMDSRQLLRIIQLPPNVRHVKQLIFLPGTFDGGSSEVRGVALCCIVLHCVALCNIVLIYADIGFSCSRWDHEVYQHPLLQATVSDWLTRPG